ncbi:MAG TPA: M1 family aminopeptidase [Trebonia sp.]
MAALTQSEASDRAALITVDGYQVSLDLTVTPVRSRTVIRFRCARPGAASFADLTAGLAAPLDEGAAVLNGVPLGPAADGRLPLAPLAAQNVLTVDCEVPERALTRFTEPSGGEYVTAFAYPTGAPALFCCFDQLDLPAPLSLSLRAPAGWTCVANGEVAQRPAPGEDGTWSFAPLRMKPLELTFCAGPLRAAAVPEPAGAAGTVLTSYRRAGLAAVTTGYLERYAGIAAGALRRYTRELGVPCAYRKYDIVALPDVPFRAASVPGLMLVSEDLLARLADPEDDFAAMISAHEVAHLWFGCLVGMRWWDDLWLEESLATYLSYWTDAGWASFALDGKARALQADELPTTQPVSSPVATMAQAVDRPNAITYDKGTAVVRQLAALIGADAVTAGLSEYLTRFAAAGSACLDDLVGCWSRASGRDLSDWAGAWLRTAGIPRLAATVAADPDGAIAALTVTQDPPRPQRIGVALYDTGDDGRLSLRQVSLVELTGAETKLPDLASQPLPAAVIVNAGDWALAQVTIDDRSLAALAQVAFDVGDPLTEAAGWNAAWYMMLDGPVSAVQYASLVARRLYDLARGVASPLAPSAAEELLNRALTCAERYVPRSARAGVRTMIAGAALCAARRPDAPDPLRRALLTGFAVSAEADRQLAVVRALLDGEEAAAAGDVRRPEETLAAAHLAADLTLRAALVRALAVRGLDRPGDFDSLTAADPVGGEPLRATCAAARPDPAAKEAAWTAALDVRTPQRLARAHADGIWVVGQESILAGYRDRYFTEALPALNARGARGERRAPRLAGMLFPVTFADRATFTAVRAALDGTGLTDRIRAVLLEHEAEMVLADEVTALT